MSMKAAGAWNALFGAALVYGGVTGKFVIFGTSSPELTLGVGVLMLGWGGSQLWRGFRAR